MKRTQLSTALVLALGVVACGGGEPAEEQPAEQPAAGAEAPAGGAAAGEMTMPSWMQVDEAAQTVTMDITAGATPDLNYWNYNGATNGNATIQVPVGYTVTINFSNSDPNMAHSLGIEESQATWGASLQPNPVFQGALTSNPTSMTDGTMPGESETITFTASEAGDYAMVCYIPGHAATGMWVRFNVVEGQQAGAQGFSAM